jgi:hypothetical protein
MRRRPFIHGIVTNSPVLRHSMLACVYAATNRATLPTG